MKFNIILYYFAKYIFNKCTNSTSMSWTNRNVCNSRQIWIENFKRKIHYSCVILIPLSWNKVLEEEIQNNWCKCSFVHLEMPSTLSITRTRNTSKQLQVQSRFHSLPQVWGFKACKEGNGISAVNIPSRSLHVQFNSWWIGSYQRRRRWGRRRPWSRPSQRRTPSARRSRRRPRPLRRPGPAQAGSPSSASLPWNTSDPSSPLHKDHPNWSRDAHTALRSSTDREAPRISAKERVQKSTSCRPAIVYSPVAHDLTGDAALMLSFARSFDGLLYARAAVPLGLGANGSMTIFSEEFVGRPAQLHS